MSRNIIVPSYKEGFATCPGESENPGLWDRLQFYGATSLGVTGKTLRDTSGRKDHGALTNAPTWVATDMGWSVHCVKASSHYIALPTLSNPTMPATGWTVGARFRYEDTGSGFLAPFSLDAYLAAHSITPYIDLGDQGFSVRIYDGGGDNIWLQDFFYGTPGDWVDLFFTFRAGTLSAYVNGALAAGATDASVGDIVPTTQWTLMCEGGPTDYLQGEINSFGIWHRVLALPEIEQLAGEIDPIHQLQDEVFPAAVAPGGVAPTSHLYGPLAGCLGGPA